MYYTRLLKHTDEGCSVLKESSVKVSPYIEQIVPDYFNHADGDGFAHVLIICSDSCDPAWTDEEFQSKFLAVGNQCPELLSAGWERDNRSKRLCVHIDKTPSIPAAIKRVMDAVSTCYGDVKHVEERLNGLSDLFEESSKTIAGYCHSVFVKAISVAKSAIGCQRTLYIRIILPERCFNEFKDQHFPPFVECVVLGQLQDPRIQDLETEAKGLQKTIEEKEEQINSLTEEKNRLKSEFADKKTVPKSEVNKMISDYTDQISKLRDENERLRTQLDQIYEILRLEKERTKTYTRTF